MTDSHASPACEHARGHPGPLGPTGTAAPGFAATPSEGGASPEGNGGDTGAAAPSLSLVVPTTGEVVSLDDAPACVRALTEIRALEDRLKEAKAELTAALQAEFRRQGTKTLEIGGVKAELRGGSSVVWDVEVLEELRDLGLSEERMNELVTTEVTYKVNASVAKSISSANEEYAEVIGRAKNTIPKPAYVTVSK